MLKRIYERLIRSRWELGFVKGGLDGVFSDGPLEVDWVVNPYRDRWFADPFILDVTDDYIYVLAEEFRFNNKKGRIAKLFINRQTLKIERFIILLELPVHSPIFCVRMTKCMFIPRAVETRICAYTNTTASMKDCYLIEF